MRVLFLVCILATTGCDQDPLGLARRQVVGPYQLRQWEDGRTYQLVERRRADRGGGVLDGDVLRLGWSSDHILAQRRAMFGGTIDWMVVDVERGEVSGPFTEAQIHSRADLARLTLCTADEAWRKL